MLVLVGLETELPDDTVDEPFMHVCRQVFDPCVEFQVLVDIQAPVVAIVLWAVANPVSDKVEVPCDVAPQDTDFTAGRFNHVGQALESSAFAGSVDTKQRKALTVVDCK